MRHGTAIGAGALAEFQRHLIFQSTIVRVVNLRVLFLLFLQGIWKRREDNNELANEISPTERGGRTCI